MVEKTRERNWSKKTKFLAYFGVVFCTLFLFFHTVFSAGPAIVSYQGKLLQSGSQVNGTKQITFSLYDSATGGNILYTAGGLIAAPAPVSVAVNNGIFSVNFGDSGTNPLDPNLFKNNSNIYLQVSIDGEDLLPRKQITSYPYAFSSLYANTSTYANSANFAETANNANTSSYANNAATSTYATVAGSSLLSGTSTYANTSSYALNAGLFGGMTTSSFATSSHTHNLSVLTNDIGFVTSSGARNAISVSSTSHLSYATSTGIISVASGYNIPLIASTTYWQTYTALVSSAYGNWNTAYTLANQWNTASTTYLTTTTASSTYLQKTIAALLYAPIIHTHATSDITSGIFDLTRGGTGTSTFANGGLVFSDGSKLTQNVGQLYWDNTNGSLDVGANVTANGSVLNVVGTSTMENIMPAADNTYNLGAPDNTWKNIYGENFCFGSDCGLVTTTIIYNVTSTIAGLNIVSQSSPTTRTLIWPSVDGPLYIGNTTTQISPGWDIGENNDLVVGGDMYTFGRGFFQTGFTMNMGAGIVFGKGANNGLMSYNSFPSSSSHFIWDADHYSKIIEIGDRYNWDHDYTNADMPDPTLVIRSNARAHSGGAISDSDFGTSVISASQSLQLSYNSSSTNAHYLNSNYTNPSYYPVGGLVLSQSGGITIAPSAKTAMYLDSNSYVGIGTTTPNYPLTVSGTIYADNLQLSNNGTINNIPLVASSTYWQTYATIVSSSYNSWNNASAVVSASSSEWNAVYNASTTWNNTTAQVNASSSQWYNGYTLANQLNNASTSWNNTAGYFDNNGSLLISHGGTGVTTTFATGSVIFSDGSKLAENNNNFYWDNNNKRLGIGTNAPDQTLSINGNINITTPTGNLYINNVNVTKYLPRVDGTGGQVLLWNGSNAYWGDVTAASALPSGSVMTSTPGYLAIYNGTNTVTGTSAITFSGNNAMIGGGIGGNPYTSTTTLTVGGYAYADHIITPDLRSTGNSYLGTILSGVWNGTAITNNYIASATYWGDAAATVYASSSYWQNNSALVAASSSKWDTAYSWGNHAAQGYLKTESDPVWNAASSSYFKFSDWKATTTDALAEGVTNLYFTNARARNSLSSSITAINYAASTGIFSLNSNYLIPLVASTTYWQNNSAIVAASSSKWDLVYNSSSTWNNTSALVAASSSKWDLVYNSSSTWNNTAGYFNSGILKITNGGTNNSTIGSAGTVAYSNGTSYNFTSVGTNGSVLMSNGSGAPTWMSTSSLGLLSGNGAANYLLKYSSATTTAISSIYDNNGIVGIGTTIPNTPTTTLTVSGTLYADKINTPIINANNSYLGTVLSGVWNGTAITDAYIASAATWNNTTAQVNASSSQWYNGYTLANQLNNASTSWNNTTAQVNASSSQWYNGYTLANQLNNASTSWNNVVSNFNTVFDGGVLNIQFGGTGLDSVGESGSIAYSDGNYYNFTGVGTNGSVLMSNGSGAPTWMSTSSLGLLSGNGAANYLLKYKTATTTVTSSVYESGGLVGVGTTNLSMALNVNGGLVATGGTETLSVTGAGTRMIWYPKKAAFRAGYVSGNNWDDFNIGSYSVAMGYNAIASNTYAIAFGGNVYATGQNSVAIGYNNTASGYGAVALGGNNIVSGTYSTAFGTGNTVSNLYSVVGGYGNNVSGGGTAVFGSYNTVSNSYSAVSGYGNTVSGMYSVVGGYNVTSTANYGIAIGRSIIAGGTYSAAFGYNIIVSGYNASVGAGYNVTSTGQTSVALGMNAISTGNQSLAFGYNVTASGNYSTALGTNNIASGANAFSLGQGMTVSGINSFGINLSSSTTSTISNNNTFAIMGGNVGIGTTSPDAQLSVIGTSTNAIFSAYTSTTQSALYVANNGNIGIGITSTVNLLTVGNYNSSGYATSTLSNNLLKQSLLSVDNLQLSSLDNGNYLGKIKLQDSGWNNDASANNYFSFVSVGVLKYWSDITMSSDGKYMTALASSSYIYRSLDYGNTWAANTSTPLANWSSVAMSSDGKIQTAVVNNGYIYTSTDYGSTWVASTAPLANWSSVAMSSDGKIQTAVVNNGYIYTSTDYGSTWVASTAPLANWSSVAMSSDGKIQTAVTELNDIANVYVSYNYGNSWTNKQTLNPASVASLDMSEDGKNILISYSDGGTGIIDTSNNYGKSFKITHTQSDFAYYLTYDSNNNILSSPNQNSGMVFRVSSNGKIQAYINGYNNNNYIYISYGGVSSLGSLSVKSGTGSSSLYVSSIGNVGIGSTLPELKLDINGDGGIIARGTYGSGSTLSTSGAGTRMFWYPKKAAFRAGGVSDTQWDNANIGDYSVALGYDTIATGTASFAVGSGSSALGNNSVAIGGWAKAIGGAIVLSTGAESTASNYSILINASIDGGDYDYTGKSESVGLVGSEINLLGSGNKLDVNDRGISMMARVGVNTTTPNYPLTISATGDSSIYLMDTSTVSGWGPMAMQIYYPNAVAGATTRLTAISFGQSVNSRNRGYINFNYVGNNSASNAVSFGFQNADNLFNILASGNVGIGTTTPTYRLSVSGTPQFTGLANSNYYICVNSAGALYSSSVACSGSDERLKTNITSMESVLSKVMNLKPVSYNWKTGDSGTEVGFIAQDMEQYFPELVAPAFGDYLGIKYDKLTAVLTKAIQEQQTEIENLKISLNGATIASSTDLTVSGDLKVIKNIEVKGHVFFGEDTIGQAKILAGATSVHVEFKDVYNEPPIMTVTPIGLHTINYGVENSSTTGFDIEINTTTAEDIIFNWHAFATNKLKVHISDGNIEIVYDDGSGTTKSILPDYVNPDNTDPSWGPVGGCTNPLAENYNPNATDDDGSCVLSSNSSSSTTPDVSTVTTTTIESVISSSTITSST